MLCAISMFLNLSAELMEVNENDSQLQPFAVSIPHDISEEHYEQVNKMQK